MKIISQIRNSLTVVCGVGVLTVAASAQITVPQSAPYTSDPYTILLEHFDGASSGSPNGSVGYTNGVFGQGVQLNDSSWILWALGALPNGTVEFWGKLDNFTNTGGAPDFIWSYLSPSQIGTGPGSTLIINVSSSDGPDTHKGMPSAGINAASFNWLHTPTNSVVIAVNTWHHYALTWGNAGLHFYVDGALVGTNSIGGQNPATSCWVVGNSNGLGFNGVMDELRISNIQRVFATTPLLSIETAAVRIKWFARSNVTYQIQSSTGFQSWSNLAAIVGMGAETNFVDWTDGTRKFYRALAVDLKEGLVAFYPFNGNANDGSGRGNDGTAHGAVPTENRFGQPSAAFFFNGVDSYIDCGNRDDFNFGTSNFSIACWVKWSNAGFSGYVISKYTCPNPNSYGLEVGEFGETYAFMTGDSQYQPISGQAVCNDGNWHFLTAVYDRAANLQIYVDAKPYVQADISGIQGLMSNTSPLLIGRIIGGDSPCFGPLWFKGAIDDVRIYNRALNEAEIQVLNNLQD